MQNITRLFDFPYYQLENHPLDKCLVTKYNGKWVATSTQEYIDKANSISRALLRMGIKPDDKIALISMSNRTEWNIMDIGILQLGAQTVPIYPTISEEDYAYILNHSEATHCFVSCREVYDKVKSIQDQVPKLQEVYSFDELSDCKNWSAVLSMGSDPSNQDEVIYGNSTAAMELLGDYPELDVILTPVGGGGLIAGTALAAHYFSNNCKVIGGEPMEADDAYRSLISGKIETNDSFHTVADGLRTHLGDRNFSIIQKHVDKIIRVEEDEIVNAMQLIWERMKIIIEPSCAVPFAAVIKNKEEFQNKKIGIILSGGNVDVTNLPF